MLYITFHGRVNMSLRKEKTSDFEFLQTFFYCNMCFACIIYALMRSIYPTGERQSVSLIKHIHSTRDMTKVR